MSVKRYVERPKTIEAIQFDGSVGGIKEIQRYLELDYVGIDWKDDFPRLIISNCTIKKGDYIIKSFQRGIEVMNAKEFDKNFKKDVINVTIDIEDHFDERRKTF